MGKRTLAIFLTRCGSGKIDDEGKNMNELFRWISKRKAGVEDIRSLETNIGSRFPKDYRGFLSNVNGGGLNYNRVNSIDEEGETRLDVLYGILNDHSVNCIIENNKIYAGRIPMGFISIGRDLGGNQLCLELDDGAIFLWDHEKESQPNSCVSVASSFNDLMTIRLILENRVPISEHPLEAAIRLGNLPIVKQVFQEEKMDPNIRLENEQFTAIEFAAKYCNQEALDYFIDRGGIIDPQSVMIFHASGRPESIKFLVRNGVDPNTIVNELGEPLVFLPVYSSNLDLLKWLHEHGASLDVMNSDRETIKQVASMVSNRK